MKEIQRDRVLALLQERGEDGISAIELDREFGIYRAAARVNELRRMGYDVRTTPRKHGYTARYYLQPRKMETATPLTGAQVQIW